MKILIVTPVPPGSRRGNRVTAVRWARLLRELGHRVTIAESFRDQSADCLIALHARRSAASIRQFRRAYSCRPLLVAMTGTDLYADLPKSRAARRSLELADRIILLQPDGATYLPPSVRSKSRVIFQSAQPWRSRARPLKSVFELIVIGHLRAVKDPFRAALAARQLPPASRIRITQVGGVLETNMEQRAVREMQRNPRYRWLGNRPPGETRRLLARSRALVITSKLEGGANVVSEAIVARVPVISSRISGSIGMLGADYPAYFPVGDTAALRDLMWRFEQDPAFRSELARRCRELRPRFLPNAERQAWRRVLSELTSAM